VRNPQTSQSFLKIQAYHLIVIQSLVFFGLSHLLLDWESTFFSERQVAQGFPHLRQHKGTPAPANRNTCAKTGRYLHQNRAIPAPQTNDIRTPVPLTLMPFRLFGGIISLQDTMPAKR
jgi:hypothetical protein